MEGRQRALIVVLRVVILMVGSENRGNGKLTSLQTTTLAGVDGQVAE